MSPLDMLIFLFFILVTVKAASDSIQRWREIDEECCAASEPTKNGTRASLSRTVRTGRPSSVRVTPIKRVKSPATITASQRYHYHLKDKGAA